MNIIGKPFSDKITEQIEARQDSLGKGIGNSTKDLLYQQTKTPWLRLASSVNITKKGDIVKNLGEFGFRENDILGSQLAQNFVLQGGAISTSNNTKNFRTNSGLNLNNSPFSGAYGWGGTTDRGFVPMPGLTEASLKYINNGALAKTEVKLKCYSRQQLAIIDALYMRPGYTLLLEYGWSVYLDSTNPNNVRLGKTDSFSSPALRTLFGGNKGPENSQFQIMKQIQDERMRTCGNYDATFAKISNFKWSLNPDGSYDCTIDLIGLGEVIESLKINIIKPAEEELGDANQGAQEVESDDSDDIPLIANATKSSLNAFLYGIYQNNPYSYDPDHEFRDANLKDFCVIEDNGKPKIIKSLNIKNGEFHCDISSTDDSYFQQSPQMYITLGYLFAWLQNNITLQNKDVPMCTFDMDFENLEKDENFFRFPVGNFSSNPLVCIVPFEQPNLDKNKLEAATKEAYNTSEGVKAGWKTLLQKWGYGTDLSFPMGSGLAKLFKVVNDTLMNSFKWDKGQARLSQVLVNVNHIAKVLDSIPEDDDNSKSLNDFLNRLLKDINKATGGVNDLVVALNDDQSKIQIRNNTPMKFDKKPTLLSKGKMCTFNTFGSGSIIRNLGIDGSIPSNFSTMVTIGAQENGNQASGNATSFSTYNLGLVDRVVPVKTNKGGGDSKDSTKAEKTTAVVIRLSKVINSIQTAGGFWSRLGGDAGGVWEDVMDDLEWETSDINSFNSLHTQYIHLLQGYYSAPVSEGGDGSGAVPFFLPFNFNIDIDGISGIKLREKFKIDDKVLPPSYKGKNMDIIVKSVDQTINVQAWLTKISTQSVPTKE